MFRLLSATAAVLFSLVGATSDAHAFATKLDGWMGTRADAYEAVQNLAPLGQAAGDKQIQRLDVPTDLVAAKGMKLAVVASCRNGRAVFTVRNEGRRATDMVHLAAFSARDRLRPVMSRTLTVKPGWSPSLKLTRAHSNSKLFLVLRAHGMTAPFETAGHFQCG